MEYSGFLTDAGMFYLRLRRPQQAVDLFRRAMALRQSIPELSSMTRANTLSNLATALFECDDYTAAVVYFRQAIELRHRHPAFRDSGLEN